MQINNKTVRIKN